MDLKQMAVFREVILTGSVSEAARNLNRTQPSVSHAIARLEDELGMKLFERRRGRLHPVPEAQYLFNECDQVLGRVSSLSQNMKRMKSMRMGELRLVSMPGPAAVLLPRLVCSHVGANPDVQVTLLSRSSDAVAQLVGAQQFDIGVADHDPSRDLEAKLLRAETFHFKCVCAVPAASPLAKLAEISAADLSGYPMATLFPEHRSYAATRQAFDTVGAAFSVRFVGQFFLQLLTYVGSGHAASVIDPLTAESWRLATPDPGMIAYRPFVPAVAFDLDVLKPNYRPDSLLSQSFSRSLTEFLRARSTRS